MRIIHRFSWLGSSIVILVLMFGMTLTAKAAPRFPAISTASVSQKMTLGETSISGPSLWARTKLSVANTWLPADLLAWAGTDPFHSINILISANGLVYDNKSTLNEYTISTPAIIDVDAMNQPGDAWILAWTGIDANHSLNILYDVNGERLKLTLPESSSSAPSLMQFGGQIWIAWADTSPQHFLHVQPLGPKGLTPGASITLPYSSLGAPMLVNDDTNHQLLLSWTDTGHSSYLPKALPYINIVASNDGAQWHTVLPAPAPQLSNAGPSLLAALNSTYAWSWTGIDPLHSLNLATTTTVNNWPAPITTFDEQSFGNPALGLSGTNIIVGWTGADPAHHLNIAIAAPTSAPPTPVSTPAATPTPVLVSTPTTTPTPVAPGTTATPVAACASITPGTNVSLPFQLPPNTVTDGSNGASGAGYYVECTPGATSTSIKTFFNTTLPQSGWRAFNPQTDQPSCNEPNSYWNWIKGNQAIGYNFTEFALPQWRLAVCEHANQG